MTDVITGLAFITAALVIVVVSAVIVGARAERRGRGA